MNNLNQLIANYTQALNQGEIQIAYKGIMEFMGKLRAELIKKYPEYQVSGIYQGYMDMSYFSMASDSLKDKGLKIAIVYLHETGLRYGFLHGIERLQGNMFLNMWLKHRMKSRCFMTLKTRMHSLKACWFLDRILKIRKS